ncbi:MAG TPA: hypothetical protein VFQ07_01325, partial [Candidatus Polarisedimenticolia bacterium]|nr:hypothetical protein [Candidatus Polarisedimenticolia bacterium]
PAPAPAAPSQTPAPAQAPPTAPAQEPTALGVPQSPVELHDRFEKVQKLLRKAADAIEKKDLSRTSFLLERSDEELTRFEAGSNVGRYLGSLETARRESEAGHLPAAADALKSARAALPPIGDYTVARSMEVAYRAALQGAETGDAGGFLDGLRQMDEATLAGTIAAGCRDIKEATARARKAVGRNDIAGGRKEIDAAAALLARLDYGGVLTRARSGLLLASELLRDGAFLAARDQTQRGLRELSAALENAPETDKETLTTAQEEARTVWRRMSKPEKEDPDRLALAGDRVETLRRTLRS